MSDTTFFAKYANRLSEVMSKADWEGVAQLAFDIELCWREGRQVFLCGNGGSAGNAIHLANDFLYGIAKKTGAGLRAHALPSNVSIVTCLANDVGYNRIFSEQLAVLADEKDVLVVLSGSGNSPNVVDALQKAAEMSLRSYAIVGFGGGHCKDLADVTIHFPIYDMQLAEDMQLVVGHMVMQWLYYRRTASTV